MTFKIVGYYVKSCVVFILSFTIIVIIPVLLKHFVVDKFSSVAYTAGFMDTFVKACAKSSTYWYRHSGGEGTDW